MFVTNLLLIGGGVVLIVTVRNLMATSIIKPNLMLKLY